MSQQYSVPTIDHWKETEIDFGVVGAEELSVDISDSGITTSSRMFITQSLNQPTGKDQDEATMDDLIFKVLPGSGSFTLQITSLTGPIHDKLKVFYNYA